jgi:hypothetical protein
MKFVNKKTILLLIASSLVLSCTQTGTTNLPAQVNPGSKADNQTYGTVKFNFDFPAKFVSKVNDFSIKAIDTGKINRVKLKVESGTTSYVIERNVELVPGGISATLSLPLDRVYIATVVGLNDNDVVSGSEIKGFFALKSAVATSTVEINQASTPIAKILEALKPKLIAAAKAFNGTNAKPDADGKLPEPPLKMNDVELDALVDLVKRARGAAHPSLVNIPPFVDAIIKENKIPVEVPVNPLLKPGRIKGTITGLKFNEVAIITVGDPASRQTIIGTPTQVIAPDATEADADEEAPAVDFIVDNVTPGTWEINAVSSGYTLSGDGKVKTVAVTANADATSSFTLTSSEWLKAPNTVSGNIGTSDQSNSTLDPANNIHLVWRQDGFDTDTNSGVIFYSRWNGTSWTTQGENISQYNESNLKGSRDPSVAVGLDRLPQVVWSGKDSSGARKIYYNKFNGTTWQSPSAISGSNNGVTPTLAVDKTNGFLYAAWETSGVIYLSQYDKTNWSNAITVGTGVMPKLAVGTDSIVHLVWKSDSLQKLQYAGWTLSKGLSTPEIIPMGAFGSDIANSIETCMDRFNRLHLVWRNDNYIQYILRSNVSWSAPELVNQVKTALLTANSGASLSIAPTGIVNVAWVSPLQTGKQVVRFRRRLPDGWKQPFTPIIDPNVIVQPDDTPGTIVDTEIKHSENIDGYEDIPLSQISSGVEGKPLIVADYAGKIHVIWSNKGVGSNDTDLLHSVKTLAK